MRHLPLHLVFFWLLLITLAPLLLWQGRRTRRSTLRLPEAKGPHNGSCGTGTVFNIHIIGESPVAGVGVSSQAQGIGPALARPLAALLKQEVHWRCHGYNGATLQQLLQALPPLTEAQCVVAMFGVNDVTQLTSLNRWRRQLAALRTAININIPIYFAPVPPMQHFTALPAPLSTWLGLRATLLNKELAKFCANQPHCYLLSYTSTLMASELLACDGYHPSAAGYKKMGADLATLIAKAFRQA